MASVFMKDGRKQKMMGDLAMYSWENLGESRFFLQKNRQITIQMSD